jgi:LacI family transcriptional regulator
VLNNRGGVSKQTRERILQAIQELGYKPNILASRLKSEKLYTIAVIIPKGTKDIPFWYQYQEGFDKILKELHPFGVNIDMHYFSQNNHQSFKSAIDKVVLGKYDGVFVVPIFYNETLQLMEHCNSNNIPTIYFNSNIKKQNNLSYVGQNAFDSGFTAAELMNHCIYPSSTVLIVSIVRKDDNHSHFMEREMGFRNFFSRTKTNLIKYEHTGENSSSIEEELSTILKSQPKIAGLFVVNGIHKVAPIIKSFSCQTYTLIGYDLTKENIKYLQDGLIDFLISQKPDKQSYQGIKLFYEHLILKQPIQKDYFMPIDIVMKSNLKYYQ